MNKNLYNKLIIFINILTIIAGFLFIFAYLYYDICTDHDHFYIFQLKPDRFLHDGRYVLKFFSYLFYIFLPTTFNLHMNTISNTIHPFTTAAIITVISVVVLKLFYLFSPPQISIIKRKSFCLLYPAVFIISTTIPSIHGNLPVFYFNAIASTLRYYDNYANYIFFIVFIYALIISFFKKIPLILKILYIINAILLGCSTEILYPVSIFFALSIFIYSIILYKNKLLSKQILIFNFVIFIFLLLSSTLHYSLSSLGNGTTTGHNELNLFDFTNISNRIIPFVKTLFRCAILENLIYIIILLLLFTILYFKRKDNPNIKIFSTISFFIINSFFIFFILIFFMHSSNLVYNFSYWLDYYPLKTFYSRTLIILITILTGCLINNVKLKEITKTLIQSLIIIFLYSIILFNFNQIIYEFKYNYNYSKVLRKAIYQADKMSLLYYDLDGFAILPISFYENYTNSFLFRPICMDSHEEIKNRQEQIMKKEVEEKNSRLFIWEKKYNKASIDYLYYFQNAYGKKLKGVIFVDDNIAFQEFYKRNGSFSDKELKNTNFTYLKRLNYNLNIDKELILYPNASFLWAAKCSQNIDIENFNDAISYCSNAINLNNNEKNKIIHYYYLRAKAFEGNKDYKQSAKDFSKFIELSPYSFLVRNELANVYKIDNNINKAIKVYQELVNIFPFYPSLGIYPTFYSDLAELQYKAGNYKEALKNIKQEEKYNELYYHLSQIKKDIETNKLSI